MAAGQQLDLDALAGHDDRAQMETIHRAKTGALLAACLEMGACCAGRDAEFQRRLAALGESVGLAFQMVDDILDETATSAELGKTPGKDRDQRKLSAVIVCGGIEAARAEAQRLAEAAQAELAALGLAESGLAQLFRKLVERGH
jgi:geranylgeranyl pyrophosphate synthase